MAQRGQRRKRRLVVVGGDAGGMAAASQARRLQPDGLDVVALEKGRWTSYSACGIPYVVGGDVAGIDDLVVRDPRTFREQHNIDARTRHEATAIDLDRQRVEVRDHEHGGRTYTLPYDVLHVATGARPVRPDLPGIDGPAIHGVQTLEDASDLLDHARGPHVERVVVVGGGYIGLEIAEAFVKRGVSTTVVTATPQPLGMFDADMGALVAAAMREHGIELLTGVSAAAFEPGCVHTDDGRRLAADLVVLGIGVEPNTTLAAAAGLGTGARGAIRVDRRQRTTTHGDTVYAAGDCCESFHLVTGERVHVALGTVANKQGRVAGTNIGGGYATFPGVVGTAITRLCDLECGRTGVTEREAAAAGFDVAAVTIESTTKAGYFPGAEPMTVKMLAERGSGRVVGAQIVGGQGAAKRIDVVATAITAGMTVEEMTALDLAYAPPFSPVWDPVLIAARKLAEAV